MLKENKKAFSPDCLDRIVPQDGPGFEAIGGQEP